MAYDVFLSYRRLSNGINGVHIARSLQQELRAMGLNVFFDMEELTDGKFNEKLYDAIEDSKNVIFLMTEGSLDRCVNEGDWVRKELEHVFKHGINLIPVAPTGTQPVFPESLPELLAPMKMLEVSELNLEKLFRESVSKIVGRLKDVSLARVAERKNVQYLSETDKFEFQRLKKEEELLYPYEKPIYDRLLNGKSNVNVLDLNFLNAESSFRRLVRDEVNRVCCFGYNDYYVQEANRIYEEYPAIKFYKIDINEDNIAEKLSEALEERNIERFDFVNLTMALLDLKNPYKVLKQIRNFLSEDAAVYVRDIDDGVVFAYPDENKLFEQVKALYKKDRLSGSRESARQVYNIFKRLGARKIQLEHCGIATDKMSFRQKDMLFDTWFGFIPNDYNIMRRETPKDVDVQRGLEWIEENFDRLEEAFHSDVFLFNSGYFIYTVQF